MHRPSSVDRATRNGRYPTAKPWRDDVTAEVQRDPVAVGRLRLARAQARRGEVIWDDEGSGS